MSGKRPLMKKYKRILGAGLKNTIFSICLLGVAFLVRAKAGLPPISESSAVRYVVFVVSCVFTAGLMIWSFRSLSPDYRGRKLVKSGTYAYFRHPIYAAFLLFFDFGLAVLLNNWIFVVWAVALHPLWHWGVRSEEAVMSDLFPDEYENYSKKVGRFFPRCGSKRTD
jgi:protein-S-isoprenylcysteine O-methyltransferase Ste14